ncbi:unnamed protein product [Fraxinus pennsylvanica]|uniref:AB hydrolase-1 domain-containing protein n=1 Tax=Fraxinus pennsylvanica TaxID=56036 RepID=A0AAD2A3J7_9LAMI|nr:unnamed protein product [Fraxinus pennsylvanica]
MEENQQRHFVLVHGAGLGAWSWYKLQPLLEAAGHRVTAFDLSASGINPKRLDELRTFPDYTLPLFKVMESIPPDEKVILVGHSLGGINLAFAMEKYPEKILVAIFIAAFMPDTVHRRSYVPEEFLARTPMENFLDTQFASFGRPEDNLTSILLGPHWYKLQPLREAAGHRVTTFDLLPSGINPRSLDELRTFPDYTLPLFKVMELIPSDEKVVRVGHSLGGINLAFAMEKYPEQISMAVFIMALMPNTVHRPSYVLEEVVTVVAVKIRRWLFETGWIQVCVMSNSMCWGVPLSAHVVVVMGTQYYDGRENAHIEYSVTDLLQMMGHASRPLVDNCGKCVILCHAPEVPVSNLVSILETQGESKEVDYGVAKEWG